MITGIPVCSITVSSVPAEVDKPPSSMEEFSSILSAPASEAVIESSSEPVHASISILLIIEISFLNIFPPEYHPQQTSIQSPLKEQFLHPQRPQ